MEFFVDLPVAGINAAVTNHFVMFFRDVPDEPLYEFHGRNGFFHILVIFVSIVVEGDKVTVIFIDSRGCDYRSAKVTPDVFYDCFWVTFVWFGIYVEAFFVFPVTEGFHLFKGWTDFCLHLIEQGGTESVA